MISPSVLAARIDWTFWKGSATSAQVEQLCKLARQQKVRALAVNGSRVELACTCLEESGVKTVALVGFPLGAADSDTKRFATEVAVDQGAQEIEMVLNPGQVKDGNTSALLRELRDVAEVLDQRSAVRRFGHLDAHPRRDRNRLPVGPGHGRELHFNRHRFLAGERCHA